MTRRRLVKVNVTFETSDGSLFTLHEQATLVAENLRLFAGGKFPPDQELVARLGAKPNWTEGALALADVIEDVLVERHTGSVPVEGMAAEALYWVLRLVMNASPELGALREQLRVLLGY